MTGVQTCALPISIVAPYNIVPEIDETVAAIIVEPVAANMGLVAPNPGFLEGLRKVCDKTGTLLIFDEVITGFRLAYGGAAEYFGVVPDIWCFGKVVGGGLPVGAFGARREIMENLAPLGGVYQAGTLSGNPLAMAAGRATLELLNQEAHTQLVTTATRLADGLEEVFTSAGFSVSVPRVGSLVGLFFGDQNPPTNFDEAQKLAENGIYSKVFHALLQNGVAFAPGPYEGLFPSLVHSDQIIDTTLERAASAIASI